MLDTVAKKLYEGMFLIDTALAASDWDGVVGMIRKLLEKSEAHVISIKKWDERRLAYEVSGKSRGTYILTYFEADGGRIGDIERDTQLSERILRVLILNADKVSREDIERDTPATAAERAEREEAQAQAEPQKAPEGPKEGSPE